MTDPRATTARALRLKGEPLKRIAAELRTSITTAWRLSGGRQERAARNADIIGGLLAGESSRRMGAAHGLSASRARMILMEARRG